MKNPFFTAKSFITGIIFCVLIAFLCQYSVNVVHGSYMAIDHMPAGAIFIFFVFSFLVNSLLRKIKPSWAYTGPELLLVYTMMLVASSVTEMGLGNQLFQVISGSVYYASPDNKWDQLILPHLKRWLVPMDKTAVSYFYEGLPKGMHIPWGVWIPPLLCWLPFLLLLYFVTLCITVIMRKQWVEREKLIYPLTQLPLEMVRENGHMGAITQFFQNPLMWLGFFIAFTVGTFAGLHNYFDMIPAIHLGGNLQVFRRTMSIQFLVSFPVIGFMYLVNLEVAFSLWFFSLLYLCMQGFFNVTGIQSTENISIYGCADFPFLAHVGVGAMISMTAYSMVIAREHLKIVWRSAIGRITGEDRDEILSYKTAFWGMTAGFVLLTAWLCFSGMSIIVAGSFLFMALLIFFVLTRVICESGIPTFITPMIASAVVVAIFGPRYIGAAGMAALALTYVYSADIRTFPMSPMAQVPKLFDRYRGSHRPIFWAIMTALAINIIASLLILLVLSHKYGGLNLNGWYFGGNASTPYQYAADMIKKNTGPLFSSWLWRGFGAGFYLLLIFLRQNFLWWPLHPIGFAIGMVIWVETLWFSIFIAWFIKKMLLRYGGVPVYEKLKFFFLGLPLGLYTCAGIWFIIDLFTGKKGNGIFWI